ncbi:MAG TPA: recombinase family protein, partial [Thiopseudomonas sp.]|nr:recombinase family protein [Thiopseudomonas sp.]
MKRKIYGYLRASTKQQDAGRAIAELTRFVTDHGKDIASFTTENESGTTLARPKLMALLNSMQPGDVLLLEQVDRLTRLNADDWQALKRIIESKGVLIVSLDLPTSHGALTSAVTDEFTGAMLKAINGMMLDMLAAISRKDQDDRKRRQAEGIAANKHKFRGRPIDAELHKKVLRELAKGKSQRDV